LVIEPDSEDFHGGVIFRASQLSEGGATSDDPVLGANFLLGYSVELRTGALVLSRHAYDTSELAVASIETRSRLRLRVRMMGSEMEISVDGTVVIVHEDPFPHLLGGVGLRTSGGNVTATAMTVNPT
jgi:hypothetical protein